MSASFHRGGFTMTELLIGLVVLCALFGSVALVQESTMDSMSTSSTTGLLNEEAARAMNILSSEARWAESGSFLITNQQGWARLDFRVPVGYAGEPIWSSGITYAVVPSSGDSNGDAVLDEGNLVRTQDDQTEVLCHDVVAGGFTALPAGDNIKVQLSLARLDRKTNRLVSSDVRTSISSRN